MRILLLADLHIGAIKDIQYFESVFNSIIMKEIRNPTDLIVILGDYFDRLFKANEPYIHSAMKCMSTLLNTNVPIRIVYGTESHEMNQYSSLFSHLSIFKKDIRVITSVSEETIQNHRILYIPEEYIQSKETYYKDTLYSNHYDYIFGHGTIAEFMPDAVRFSHRPVRENHVPHFTSRELSEHSIITAFGHYHVHKDIDNVHYVGSLFRWKFGEEEPKGYAVIEDDQFVFIPNKDAYTYKTYEITSSDEEEIRSEILRIQAENPDIFRDNLGGKVKILFRSDNSSPSVYERIRTDVLKSSQITADMKYTTTPTIPNDPDSDLCEIIMSKSLTPTEKIKHFIQEKSSVSLTIPEIESYLQNTLSL